MQNWKALVKSAFAGGLRFGAPASAADLHRVERVLDIQLPEQLRSLLSSSNGIADARGQAWIFDASEIMHYNMEVRAEDSAYRFMDPDDRLDQQPIDEFLVFSDLPGEGDLLAICLFPVDGFRPGEIVLWEHAENDRTRIAPDLASWIEHSSQQPGSTARDDGHVAADSAAADLVS